MKIGVFVVDDHYMVIEGIRSLLQNEKTLDWMGHATNAVSCLSFLKRQEPDVILMDINLPDKSGIDLCKEVKQLYPSVAILGLSTFNQQTIIKNMIDNGAAGYVLKNATKEELMEAINSVLKGKVYYSFEVLSALRKPEPTQLLITRREKEVLLLIAEGLTNAAIAEKLFISIPTVNTHRKSLLEKFDVKNTAMLIGKATKLGLFE
ncbi:response regulator transcription factor [Pedobacter riviphilus]|uniref:Response regulator transcription factor n=1 Tax=Pedobacter riviphilus TaxID=2766984 RepID=A0ABX6TP99_9SPHI|nr:MULTISPECIES: response regulator transcription factor [Pedobacter]NII82697.1 DNA-binding NarL/FixJ family response regulator [Pedobacter sp. SG908]NMN36715.1 DNA-binding NarL/FixJ family response regulator [Pedobacter sp. SG918]QNR86409.1 response regulator transcription factor [Pedobacter riviphilus]